MCVRERDQLDQSVSPPAVCVCAGMPKQARRGFSLLPRCSRLVADTVCFSDNQLVSRPKLVAGALGTPTLLKEKAHIEPLHRFWLRCHIVNIKKQLY